MWTRDSALFQHLADACGSRYLAVNFIADATRRKAEQLPKWVIESSVITWVLTGEDPDDKILDRFYIENPELQEVDDFLAWIDDKNITDSVRQSYFDSVKAGHLLYTYNSEIVSEELQTRVRVLTRMLWYKYEQ